MGDTPCSLLVTTKGNGQQGSCPFRGKGRKGYSMVALVKPSLSDSTETLTEIAARLGFGTLRTFQRTFSDRFSMPPSRYRSLARKN